MVSGAIFIMIVYMDPLGITGVVSPWRLAPSQLVTTAFSPVLGKKIRGFVNSVGPNSKACIECWRSSYLWPRDPAPQGYRLSQLAFETAEIIVRDLCRKVSVPLELENT